MAAEETRTASTCDHDVHDTPAKAVPVGAVTTIDTASNLRHVMLRAITPCHVISNRIDLMLTSRRLTRYAGRAPMPFRERGQPTLRLAPLVTNVNVRVLEAGSAVRIERASHGTDCAHRAVLPFNGDFMKPAARRPTPLKPASRRKLMRSLRSLVPSDPDGFDRAALSRSLLGRVPRSPEVNTKTPKGGR